MKKFLKKISIFLLFSYCIGFAETPHLYTEKEKRDIAGKISAAIKKTNPNINIGIDIRSVETGQILYQQNALHLYSPASNLKILPAVASLTSLGRDFRFETTLSYDGNASNGVLDGNLYLTFDGDPTLTIGNLKSLFNKLKTLGIQKIRGNLYINNFAFGSKNFAPGWMLDDLRFCYSAPINAAIINRNCMPFTLTPADKVGKRASVKKNADYHYVAIDNQVMTVARDEEASCPLRMDIDENNVFHLSGCLAKNKNSTGLEGAISNVNVFTESILKKIMEDRNLILTGKMIYKKFDKPGTLVAHHTSDPLFALLKPMLKKSDNIIANAIFEKIGQQYYHQPTTWLSSQKALLETLRKFSRVNTANIVAVDGAGESRYDLISADFLTTLLINTYKSPITHDFTEALAISGTDGTLMHRMGDKNMLRHFRGKTGSMASTSSLSGYLTTNKNQILAVTIIINGFKGSLRPYRQLEDEIVAKVKGIG